VSSQGTKNNKGIIIFFIGRDKSYCIKSRLKSINRYKQDEII